jgi:hypothetical protein
MRRARIQTSLLVLAGVTAIYACQSGSSILLVEVSGDLSLMPQQLSVTVTAGGRTKAPLVIPPAPTPISLPTSFTIELDGSITGPVTIAIDALDGNGSVMASGTTTQTHITIGGQTLITVTIGNGSTGTGSPGGSGGNGGAGAGGLGGSSGGNGGTRSGFGGGSGGSSGGTGGTRSGFGGFNRGTGG